MSAPLEAVCAILLLGLACYVTALLGYWCARLLLAAARAAGVVP